MFVLTLKDFFVRAEFFFFLLFLDVDECVNPGVCPQHSDCVNVRSSYRCECHDGYERDGVHCLGLLYFELSTFSIHAWQIVPFSISSHTRALTPSHTRARTRGHTRSQAANQRLKCMFSIKSKVIPICTALPSCHTK